MLAAALLMAAKLAAAQEPKQWTLEECIDYAMANNISLQKSRLDKQSAIEDWKQAKSELFPSLNFSTTHSGGYRPWVNSGISTVANGTVSTSVNKTYYNGSYGIDLQWTLYEGNRRLNDYKQQKVASQIARLNVDESINNIQESIMQAYIQILYAAEAVEINRATLASSQAERRRGEELLAAGTLSKADYAQLAADESNDQYALVSAEATLDDYKLQLKQLLELGIDETIEIETPELDATDVLTPIASLNEIYRTALLCLPSIKYSELNIAAAKLDIKSAQSGYYPSLSLSAGVSTGHLSTSDGKTGSQMKNKLSESIGLLPRRESRPRAICLGPGTGESLTSQLRPHSGKIQPRHGQHARTAHREKQPALGRTASTASQVHGHTQPPAAQHLSKQTHHPLIGIYNLSSI